MTRPSEATGLLLRAVQFVLVISAVATGAGAALALIAGLAKDGNPADQCTHSAWANQSHVCLTTSCGAGRRLAPSNDESAGCSSAAELEGRAYLSTRDRLLYEFAVHAQVLEGEKQLTRRTTVRHSW